MKWIIAIVLAGSVAAQSPGAAACASAIDRGEFASAVRQGQALVLANPASASARVLLARAYMGTNNGAAALVELRQALRHDPASSDALYYTSKLAGILAQQEFAVVVESAPDSARTHQIRAEALEAQGDAAGAQREYQAALDQRPGTTSVMNALGDLNRHEKRWKPAIEWYEKVLEKDPRNYDALYGAAVCYRAREMTEQALPLFRRALQADPSSLAAKVAVGEALLTSGNAAEAIPLLEDAAKADPRFRRLQFLLGRAYKMTGRTEDARRANERGRQLMKDETDEAGDQ